jgi:3-phosphoshikimate 1-carboxyvinyltransferase
MLGRRCVNKMKDQIEIFPVKSLNGTISVSGDKSISHRAAIFASLANGETQIRNYLQAEDCMDTLKALKKLGVKIKKNSDGTLMIIGKGRYGLNKPSGKLYFGNSGTGMRLMSGVLAAQLFPSILTGDESLTSRPMRRITIPLTRMGANIIAREAEYPPLNIKPGLLKGITYNSPIASAQVKSCVLLAGLYSENSTTVTEPFKSRDHTERLMEYLNIPITKKDNEVTVRGGKDWEAKDINVPGDFSSAAFFITACLLTKGSSLKITGVNLNPTRIGFIDIVKRMNGNIEITNEELICNEPVGDINIKYTKDLNAVHITPEDVPSIIDEIPLLALLATQANGTTVMDGVGELRKKESDRLYAVSTQLQNMGQAVQEQREALIISGQSGDLRGAHVESFGDHRIAMMLIIAALNAKTSTVINGVKCIDTSFPEFFEILESVIEK